MLRSLRHPFIAGLLVALVTLISSLSTAGAADAGADSGPDDMKWLSILLLILLVATVGGTALAYRASHAGGSTRGGQIFQSTVLIGGWVNLFALVGILAILFWCDGLANGMPGQSFQVAFGADLLVAAGAAAVGALLGFIFAIPRTLDPASRAAVANAAQNGPSASSQAVLAANTNLERISDWLTTLLIGAGLVQVKDIAGWVGKLGESLGPGAPTSNAVIVPLIIIFFLSLGFLGVYLITRLYLTYAFEQTLYLLTGVSTPAAIGDLQGKLAAFLAAGSADDLTQARNLFDTWTFGAGERADPLANERIARVIARQMAGGFVPPASAPDQADLKAAVVKAAADPAIRTRLRTELAANQLTTGTAALDTELAPLVA